jgi:hypothetical protein
MEATAAPIDMRESRSVGIGPEDWETLAPGRIGTPHERQTWAHAGLARPQL